MAMPPSQALPATEKGRVAVVMAREDMSLEAVADQVEMLGAESVAETGAAEMVEATVEATVAATAAEMVGAAAVEATVEVTVVVASMVGKETVAATPMVTRAAVTVTMTSSILCGALTCEAGAAAVAATTTRSLFYKFLLTQQLGFRRRADSRSKRLNFARFRFFAVPQERQSGAMDCVLPTRGPQVSCLPTPTRLRVPQRREIRAGVPRTCAQSPASIASRMHFYSLFTWRSASWPARCGPFLGRSNHWP